MPSRAARWAALAFVPLSMTSCGGEEPHEEADHSVRAVGGDNLSETYGLAPALSLRDDLFVDDKGDPQPIHGFSWFGFNTGTGAPDGLWSNDPIGNDFERAVRRQKLLGFNAVRLPFSFAEFPKEPRSFVIGCSDVSDEDVAKATLMPNADFKGTLADAPKLAWPAKREAGQCNGYLPNTTTKERYIWTVLFYVRNGFYVLVDNHYREDQTAETNETAWVQGWSDLAHELLVAHPETQGRIFFDLLNEPGQYGQNWEKTDKAGVHHLYLAAMDAIWKVSDKAIFAIEGAGQDSLNANWGDGFCTDEAKIKQLGLGDPRPFFTELAGKPYKGAVALAPHVYGPAVTHAPKDFSGQGLTDRLDASFGALTKTGFAGPSGPLKFPVAIGEFGSKFTEQGDVDFMRDFAKYLSEGGDKHNKIDHWFYWDWNADSGDTGGLVTDNWKDIEWVKVAYLVDSLGLRPWWGSSAPAAVSPHTAPPTSGPTAPPASTPAKTEKGAPSPASTTPAGMATPSSDKGDAPKAAAATPAPFAPTGPALAPSDASADAATKTAKPAAPPPAPAPAAPSSPPAPAITPAKPEPSASPSTTPSPAPSSATTKPQDTSKASDQAPASIPAAEALFSDTKRQLEDQLGQSGLPKEADSGEPATPAPTSTTSGPSKPSSSTSPSAGKTMSSKPGSTISSHPVPVEETEGHELGLTARIGWDGHWTRDGFDYFTVNIHLSAQNQRIGVPYTVSFRGPKFDLVQESWNLDDIKIASGSVEGRVVAPWGNLLPNVGAETVIGMIYRVKEGDGKIKEVTVNGKPATIK